MSRGDPVAADIGPQVPPLRPPGAHGGLVEVYRRRYLLRLLVRSTVKSRYQGTFLGWMWSYLQPFIRFLMFYFIFQIMIGRGGVPGSERYVENFAIHLVAGMVVVHFFTETFNGGTRSLVANRGLIVKLAMPRELFPVSAMLVSLWHTVPMLGILAVATALAGWRPDPMGVVAALMGVALVGVLGLALSLFFSVANVFFRDFGKVVQTLTQFVTFSVPMIYPYTFVEQRFGENFAQNYYLLNPIAEAVLLMQRGFWVGSTSDPAQAAQLHLPDDLFQRGAVMLGLATLLLGIAQLWFSRYDKQIPERL